MEICKKWGFWEESRSGRVKGGVSLLSHSNGSIAHGWSESTLLTRVYVDVRSHEGLSEFGEKILLCGSHTVLTMGRR
jgi:hypothetical protein